MQTAQTLPSNWRLRSSTSLKPTKLTPGSNGANGWRYFAWPVVARDPNVRPWKEFSRARIRHLALWPLELLARANARASFNAPSQASVPLLQKKALSSPETLISFLASSDWYSWKNRLEM